MKRCDLWIKYSQVHNLKKLPLGSQKNIIICARHFRDESFMNYKKDRLVATAVPTIHRLSKDKALDYELELNHGVLVTLPELEKPHLIAPPGFQCPLGLDAEVSELLKSLENERSNEHFDDDGEVAEPSTSNLNLMSTDSAHSMETIETPVVRGGIKRSANFVLSEDPTSDDGNAPVKMSRNINRIKNDGDSTSGDTVGISERSETYSQPTIINHQIMDSEGRLWLQSDTFGLEDDAGYQYVQIQPQSDQSETEEINEIAVHLLEDNVEEGNVSLTDDLHLSHKLGEASIEIDDLRIQLKKESEKVKRMESKLAVRQMSCTRSDQHVASLKVDLQIANDDLEAKSMEMDILKLQLQHEKEERTRQEKELSSTKQEYSRTSNQIASLKALLGKAKSENEAIKIDIQKCEILSEKETMLKQDYEQQLQSQRLEHLKIEQQLRQQITALEQSLQFTRQQLTETRNTLSSIQTECTYIKNERLNSDQKVLVIESQLQKLQKLYDDKNEEHTRMEHSYDSLQKSNEKLKADYKMLESNQNQVSTVTTSNSNSSNAMPGVPQQQQPATVIPALTKAQLFNGIKRYISSSMCSLLRMEMFGSSEREWKSDERQVAVDLLRLGEFVYKYLTDEWRFRLPALRDVRNWLSQQSVAMDDEEDL